MPTSPTAVTSVLPARPSDLNERALKTAQPGDVLKDKEIKGLHLRCFAESKGFYLYYRTKAGVQRRPKIGDVGSITLTQARKIARDWLGQVAGGSDPSKDVADARAEPTVADLWDEIWKRHYSKAKSHAHVKSMWHGYLEPNFGRLKLSDVTYTQVADLHESMSNHPYHANRTLALLSKMFSFAYRPLGWVDDNPCKGVVRFKELKRERFMEGEEAAKIAEILHGEAKENPASVAFLYLLILTGARRGEIAKAKWSQLQGNKLVLEEHKTDGYGDKRTIHLPQEAMDVIERLPRTSGTITGILSPKKFWERVRTKAGCPDLRMHDLRHSFASVAISAGLSLAQIGELLGHKSTQTTKRYAHLMDEAAQAAANATADIIMAQMKKVPA